MWLKPAVERAAQQANRQLTPMFPDLGPGGASRGEFLFVVVALRHSLTEPLETKGAVHETLAIAFCYAAMVLGMVAQYAYRQAETRDFRFDPAAFFMPIFASPIVFLPLLMVIGEVDTTGAFAQPKLMVYLVAFQNGFFWRAFFAERAVSARSSPFHSQGA